VSSTRPTRWFYLLGAGTIAFGAALTVPLVLRPIGGIIRALGYRETECRIESAEVGTWYDSDGDAHDSVDVRYRYEAAGQSFESTRYDLWDNQKGDARAVVAGLRPGAAVRCFVDPDRPADAVVDRRLDPMRLLGLLAVLPIALGVHLIRWTWRARHWLARERRRHVELIGARPRRLALERLGATLASRLALYGLFGPALLALCLHDRWGVLGQLVRGELSFLPGLWTLILLVAVAATTALFAHTVMRALGPRFALATVLPARRGQPVVLQWRAGGVTPSIRSLSLQLVAREEADYDRPSGDSTESGTERREFFRRQVAHISRADRSTLSHGSVTVELPAFAFSFDGGYNRIRWVVALDADVAGWADVSEELELDIAP
jgi:hypothetical protein